MNTSLCPIFTLLFLLADIVTYAQGEAIFVCGRQYQDAEDNCGIHPSCADLQCPNTYWEEGHVLLSCFAVPIEKCNFGSPDAIPAAPVAQAPTFDPNNMNYCGVSSIYSVRFIVFQSLSQYILISIPMNIQCHQTIEGGWQLAVDNCSALTACPGGDPDECPEGQTCYGSITCDPSSKPNAKGSGVTKLSLVQAEILPDQAQEQGASPESTNEVFDLDTSVEITPILAEDPELPSVASIEVSGLDSSAEIYSAPAVEQGAFAEGGHDADEKANNFVQAETSSEQQASTEANSEVYAFDTNVESNSIATDTSDDGGPQVESPTSSTTTTTTFTTTATTTTTEAPEQPETSPGPNEQQHTTTQLTEPVADESVDTPAVESRNYCGPHGASEGMTRRVTMCSQSILCGDDGSCPIGMICYGDIGCNGIIDTIGHQSSYEEYLQDTHSNEDDTLSINGTPNSSSMSTAEATATTITTPSPSETTSAPKSVEVLLSHFYCGPDPSIDHNAWMTAFEQYSSETACSDNQPCPDGQICFGGIECLAKPEPIENAGSVATTETDQSPATTSVETTSISSTTEAPVTATPTVTDPTAAIEQEIQMPIETKSYCGPDPIVNGDAWMQARANCSPATACGHGHPLCPDNMFCYGQIDCLVKDSSYPVVLDGSAMSSDDVKVEEDDTITTTTSAASATTTETINLEDNTFFCGPVSAGGYFEASELCIPCHNGDPSKCGVGMTCYAGVACSKAPKSTIDEMVEEAERVHIGYCGQSFYETQDSCASRTPCSFDKDCDRWNPQCFAVTCDGIESQPSSSASIGSGISPTHTGSDTSSPPYALENQKAPTVTVTQSFCGTYEEEVAEMCTTRPPCKTTKDCPGFEGCFSDIPCTFSEQSDEFKQFLANVEAFDNPDSAESTTSPTAEQPYFGLRPPSDPDYTRSSATESSYSYLVATAIPAVVAVWSLY